MLLCFTGCAGTLLPLYAAAHVLPRCSTCCPLVLPLCGKSAHQFSSNFWSRLRQLWLAGHWLNWPAALCPYGSWSKPCRSSWRAWPQNLH